MSVFKIIFKVKITFEPDIQILQKLNARKCLRNFHPSSLWKWTHHWKKIAVRRIRRRRLLLTVGTHLDLDDLHITWHFCKARHWLPLDRLRHRTRYCFSNVTYHFESPSKGELFFYCCHWKFYERSWTFPIFALEYILTMNLWQ